MLLEQRHNRLSTSDIFKGTSGFIWKKLGIEILSYLILLLPAIILFAIGAIFSTFIAFILGIVGLVVGAYLQKLFNQYVGYMIKAAHVAVITESISTGTLIPADKQMDYGKSVVKENFAEANVYFVIDALVSKAVRQIQSKLSGVAEFVGKLIPGGESFIKEFLKATIDYVDECCLGYTFYRKDEKNKFRTSCDGIVLYFQNWKDLLKTSAKAAAISVLASTAMGIVIVIVLGLILNIFLEGSTAFIIALIFGILIAGTLKGAVIDTYVYIEIMNSYMPYATTQRPQFDLYQKFCNFSKSFKELFTKAKDEYNKHPQQSTGYQNPTQTYSAPGYNTSGQYVDPNSTTYPPQGQPVQTYGYAQQGQPSQATGYSAPSTPPNSQPPVNDPVNSQPNTTDIENF